eukprot:m.246209 g.246209  ORF g.246209 m.246209 type:complete len:56 (+) comp40261_c0_seq1:2204-2371(+)
MTGSVLHTFDFCQADLPSEDHRIRFSYFPFPTIEPLPSPLVVFFEGRPNLDVTVS